MKEKFLKKRSTTMVFGAIALVSGLYFTGYNLPKITGNAIIETQSSFYNFLPLIGATLIICSAIMFFYSIKKRD